MRKYTPYLEYKDSGSLWFPLIPRHWSVLSNRYIFNLKKSQVGKNSQNYKLLSLTLQGIIERDMENPSGKFPAEFDTYQEVKKGDFVFCLFDVEETPRTVGLSKFDGMITGAYTVFSNKLALNPEYLYYFFLSLDENKQMKPLYKGLRNTITKENFYSFKTPTPPIQEQTVIANFLDKKTAEIKEFIRLKEKTIELLKERKKAIINQAVTKGLDPNVPMRDSGIQWLGEIPKHWEVKPNKYLFKERTQRSLTGEGTLLMISQVYGLVERAKYHEKAEAAESTIGHKECYKDDLVFNKLKAHLGVFFKSTFDGKGLISPDYAVYMGNSNIDVKFYELLFRHPVYLSIFTTLATGIVDGLKRLYTGDLFNVPVPVPPLNEQMLILNYIGLKSNEFDQSISQAQQEITLIKEYQQSLISEAVTGKIDVREYAGNI